MIKINHLIPTERGLSWRKTTDKVAKLMVSIREDGLQKPISIFIYNEKYYVIDGHHRLEALKRLGYEDIPINELSEAELSSKYYRRPDTLPEDAYKNQEHGAFKVDGRRLKQKLKELE